MAKIIIRNDDGYITEYDNVVCLDTSSDLDEDGNRLLKIQFVLTTDSEINHESEWGGNNELLGGRSINPDTSSNSDTLSSGGVIEWTGSDIEESSKPRKKKLDVEMLIGDD